MDGIMETALPREGQGGLRLVTGKRSAGERVNCVSCCNDMLRFSDSHTHCARTGTQKLTGVRTAAPLSFFASFTKQP